MTSDIILNGRGKEKPVGETIDTTNSGDTGREDDKLSSQGLNPPERRWTPLAQMVGR
jgi:hypothetical protein